MMLFRADISDMASYQVSGENDMVKTDLNYFSKKRKNSVLRKYLSLVMMIISHHQKLLKQMGESSKNIQKEMESRGGGIGLIFLNF